MLLVVGGAMRRRIRAFVVSSGTALLLVGLLSPVSADDAGAWTATGTGQGAQEEGCANQYVIEGASVDGEEWTFTVAYNSRFASTRVVLVPCPWVPASAYEGPWDPALGGTIPTVEPVDGFLSLTAPNPGAGSNGGDAYTLTLCVEGLCSKPGGSAELFFAPG